MSESLETIARSLGGQVSKGKKYRLVTVTPDKVREACSSVAVLPGYHHLSTMTGVDLGKEISITYHFWAGREFIAVRTSVPKENRVLPSVTGELPAATLYEAEIADLFGVTFSGSPLTGRRLLLPDNYPKEAPPPLTKEADPEKIRRMMGLE
jgi:Ni,Fe-hydrogenase III component G